MTVITSGVITVVIVCGSGRQRWYMFYILIYKHFGQYSYNRDLIKIGHKWLNGNMAWPPKSDTKLGGTIGVT